MQKFKGGAHHCIQDNASYLTSSAKMITILGFVGCRDTSTSCEASNTKRDTVFDIADRGPGGDLVVHIRVHKYDHAKCTVTALVTAHARGLKAQPPLVLDPTFFARLR